MAVIFAIKKDDKARVEIDGDIVDLMTLQTVIGEALADKMAKERKISKLEAEDAVVDCFRYSMKTKV